MTFVDLVAGTLEHVLVPVVVPELETITVGGAVSGCSIESSPSATAAFTMRVWSTRRNVHRIVERKLLEIGGVKTLISHNYFTPEELWSVWNKPNHDAVKARTDPDGIFRDLSPKTGRAARGVAG